MAVVRHLFVVAGIPLEVERLLDGDMRRSISGDYGELLVGKTLYDGPHPRYDEAYRSGLLNEAANWVEALPDDEAFTISLIYADSGRGDTQSLLDDFFPFSLTFSIASSPPPEKGNEKRALLNRLARELKPVCANLRSRGKIMHEHMASKANSTPLLLPIHNFGSSDLYVAIFDLFKNAGANDGLERKIKEVTTALSQKLSLARVNGKGDNYFVNDDSLVFVPPGNNSLHGLIKRRKPGDGHSASCVLIGRSRLGGSFNPRFHYDCQPARGGLKRQYMSCHQQVFDTPRVTHVNIAPNDNVR